MIFCMVLFEVSGFLLLALREGGLDPFALGLAALVPALFALQAALLTRFFPYVDKYLFIIVHFLCGIGLIVLYRLGSSMGMRQLTAYALGCVAQWAALIAIHKVKTQLWWKLRWAVMGVSLALLLAATVLGKETYGATNWIQLGGFSMQPSEFVKVALAMILALYLSRAPKLRELLPAGAFVIACVGFLILQKDLGAVLIYFAAALFLYYAATSDLFLTGLGVLGSAGGAVLCYQQFAHVRVRVAVWQNPWALFDEQGYQIVQSLMAIGSGGLMGLGLGQGLPRSIPVFESDFIFAAVAEEFGIVIALCILALYALIILRGCLLATRAKDDFSSLLAFAVSAIFTVQTFLIVGGVINMIPLTGVTLPFISSGGSSMLSCLAMMGLLLGLSAKENKGQAAAWRAARDKLQLREKGVRA